MHARMTTVHIEPGMVDAAVAAYLERIPQTAREMGGKGSALLVNRETGEAMSFTMWEDEAAMRATEERAGELRRSTAEEMGWEVTRVEHFEVANLDMD